jgi:aminopeptidase YwaD
MDPVASKIACYMKELCGHEDRHPGRPGNRAATALFKRVAESCGLEVETSELECIDVERGELTLEVGGDRFEFRPGPYSNGCDVTAALTEASTIEQLEAGGYEGSVLVLHGELCREQLRPRGYPFYEMPEHDRILDALEAARPAAVIAATGLNPMSSGAVSPFPLTAWPRWSALPWRAAPVLSQANLGSRATTASSS